MSFRIGRAQDFFGYTLQIDERINLIPVKPIGENESEIKNILSSKLLALFAKIKP